MPWGAASPEACERKSWSLTGTGAGSQVTPSLRKRPTNSFFFPIPYDPHPRPADRLRVGSACLLDRPGGGSRHTALRWP